MSVEQGVHNGRMLDDRLFGAARNPDAILPSIEQFDYYSGGGIDIAFLGVGEADSSGNVNVSHLGGNLIGPGGFIEIAQNAKKVVFCGTFDAQGSKISWSEGRLTVVQPGKVRKFVREVERITFAADYARKHGQEVLYITERAVFRLLPGRPRFNRDRARHRHPTRHPAVYGIPPFRVGGRNHAGLRFRVACRGRRALRISHGGSGQFAQKPDDAPGGR